MKLGALAGLAIVASCGDNLPPPEPGPLAPLVFSSCLNGMFECGTLVVPADWSSESALTIELPVVRAPARDPSQRIGVLVFNFGGPGEPTLQPIVDNYPAQPIATSQDLTARFDWVLMDWRGVATTTPELSCLDATTGSALAAEQFAPGSDADWAALFSLGSDVAAGCLANGSNAALLARQDTDSAARDLEALRIGLGESQLNMWGVSYGTRLASMYASIFPEHVRAFALDSPMFPQPSLPEFLTAQSESFDAELGRFFAWCAGASATDCPFRTADGSGASVAAEFEQLLDNADTSPIVADGVTLDRASIDLAATTQMYFPTVEWPPLATALASLEAGDGSAMAKLVMSSAFDSANDDNAFSSYQNVCAQDMPIPAGLDSPASFEAFAMSLEPLAPHVGLQNAAAQAFAVTWPTIPPFQHPIGNAAAPPLLVTATRNDPATPYAWASELVAAFDNGSYLVTYEGDGHANAQFHRCIGEVTASFLIDPTKPPSTTDCPEVDPTAQHARETRAPIAGRPQRR
ncbi:MAG TPA: alpha/beta hydrolase [Kofleriaceae bacterium]